MKTSEMKKDIKRTYPDAKIKPVQSGSYKFEVVVTEFGREKKEFEKRSDGNK